MSLSADPDATNYDFSFVKKNSLSYKLEHCKCSSKNLAMMFHFQ